MDARWDEYVNFITSHADQAKRSVKAEMVGFGLVKLGCR